MLPAHRPRGQIYAPPTSRPAAPATPSHHLPCSFRRCRSLLHLIRGEIATFDDQYFNGNFNSVLRRHRAMSSGKPSRKLPFYTQSNPLPWLGHLQYIKPDSSLRPPPRRASFQTSVPSSVQGGRCQTSQGHNRAQLQQLS